MSTQEKNKIIVPVDFSPSSLNAMEYAIYLAQSFDYTIDLVYVLNERRFATIFTGSDTKRLIVDGIENKLQQYKAQIIEKWPEAVVDHMILEGKPYKVIEGLTEADNADLVVMGTNGETGIERFIGSTTRRVLSSSEVPVVAIKNKVENPKFDNIVLPIDLTKTSKQKVAWAMRLAKHYNSTIHIIMEVQKDEFLMKKVRNNLNQVEGILAKNNVKYVSKLLDDLKYPDNIGIDTIRYAEEVQADLIVIMTQQESVGLSQIFIGNYAEQIVNSSQTMPVISINPRKTTLFEGGVGFY